MKMEISTAELTKALYRVQGIADKKSTMPILAHVLLEARPGEGLFVSATDLDVGLTGSYDAQINEGGATAVHARQLYEIVKALATETVSLETQDNNWVEIKSGNSRFRLVGMVADEFPALPDPGQIKTFKIPASTLGLMIDRTLFCVSTDDNRHNLSGVYCECPKSQQLRMVSTDGHRLALAEHVFDSEISIEAGVIVPRKGFQELKRVLNDTNEAIEEVELGFSGTNGVLRAGSVTLSTRLVDGTFPDYEQVIPSSPNKIAKISRPRLSEALRRVSLLSQGRAYGVRLALTLNQLELIAEDPEFGDAHESLPVEYNGEELTVGFNARYLLDVLALVQDETVCLRLTDELSPGIIQPLEEVGFVSVVMPVRI